jgi:uncharacterized protein YkwD
MWAGLTFLVGFAAVIWLGGAAVEDLRGPRAALMRELNAQRAAAGLSALRADRHLGRVAQGHAQALARGSAVAQMSRPEDLERSARSRGWRGTGPIRELRVRGSDAVGALHALGAPGAWESALDPAASSAGVGLAAAGAGDSVAVVLLAR